MSRIIHAIARYFEMHQNYIIIRFCEKIISYKLINYITCVVKGGAHLTASCQSKS